MLAGGCPRLATVTLSNCPGFAALPAAFPAPLAQLLSLTLRDSPLRDADVEIAALRAQLREADATVRALKATAY